MYSVHGKEHGKELGAACQCVGHFQGTLNQEEDSCHRWSKKQMDYRLTDCLHSLCCLCQGIKQLWLSESEAVVGSITQRLGSMFLDDTSISRLSHSPEGMHLVEQSQNILNAIHKLQISGAVFSKQFQSSQARIRHACELRSSFENNCTIVPSVNMTAHVEQLQKEQASWLVIGATEKLRHMTMNMGEMQDCTMDSMADINRNLKHLKLDEVNELLDGLTLKLSQLTATDCPVNPTVCGNLCSQLSQSTLSEHCAPDESQLALLSAKFSHLESVENNKLVGQAEERVHRLLICEQRQPHERLTDYISTLGIT